MGVRRGKKKKEGRKGKTSGSWRRRLFWSLEKVSREEGREERRGESGLIAGRYVLLSSSLRQETKEERGGPRKRGGNPLGDRLPLATVTGRGGKKKQRFGSPISSTSLLAEIAEEIGKEG